ncbi:MAG TPA: serine O-acetyltransferase EpsC [Flavisolibacter sp.]|jgi:serine O-acetyltransferase|nr:serine O-acetyltransferase EpsC [Flavisolibacter sp.]
MNESAFINDVIANKMKAAHRFPDKALAGLFVEDIFRFLFIGKPGEWNKELALAKWESLKAAFTSLLSETITNETEVKAQTTKFFYQLPHLYKTLFEDAEAILNFDPAAQNLSEVIVAYPGFYATVIYRLSHHLWRNNIRLLARLFTEFAHSKTGIDIHPGAQIGHAFVMDHGTGIVIGETAVIGDNVKIYQGVTLGALHVGKSFASTRRHPTVEDHVIIYSGATILGGETVIGKGSIIGGNVWLTYSVPPNSVVYHTSEVKIKDKNPFPEPLNYVI